MYVYSLKRGIFKSRNLFSLTTFLIAATVILPSKVQYVSRSSLIDLQLLEGFYFFGLTRVSSFLFSGQMLSRNIFWPSDIRQGIETQLRGSRMLFLLHFCRRFLSRWQLLSRNILWPSDIRQGIETLLRGSRILFLLH